MTFHPPEILFHLGPLTIRSYGVFLGLAIFCAFWWAEVRAQRAGFPERIASDVFFWAIVGAIIGARLGFVLQESAYFGAHPHEILALWHGGLSFHGGLVGAIIAGLLVLNLAKATSRFWALADSAAAPLLLGAIIGRLGNWANQELYGYPTHVPWAIAIDRAHRLPGYEGATLFHPTFAYEMGLNLLGLLILICVIERRSDRRSEIRDRKEYRSDRLSLSSDLSQRGTSFLFVIAWYAIARGITEIWRIGDRIVGPLSLAQVVSILMVVIAGSLFFIRQRPSRQK